MLCCSAWNGNAEVVPNTTPVANANGHFHVLCLSFSMCKSLTNWWKVRNTDTNSKIKEAEGIENIHVITVLCSKATVFSWGFSSQKDINTGCVRQRLPIWCFQKIVNLSYRACAACTKVPLEMSQTYQASVKPAALYRCNRSFQFFPGVLTIPWKRAGKLSESMSFRTFICMVSHKLCVNAADLFRFSDVQRDLELLMRSSIIMT